VSARVALRRLEALGRRRTETEAAIAAVVGTARAAGAPWSAVGAALGVSAQAAQQRYGPRPDRGAMHQGSLSGTRHQASVRTPRSATTGGAQTRKGRRI
jgi:hypothetical protein